MDDVRALKEEFATNAIIYRNNKQWNSGPTPVVIRDTAQAIAKHAAALEEELDGLDGVTLRNIRDLNINQLGDENNSHEIDALIRHGIVQEIIDGDGEAELDIDLIHLAVKLMASQAQGTVNHLESVFKKYGSKTPKPSYKSRQELMMLVLNLRTFWNKQTGEDITSGFDEIDEYGEPAIIPTSVSAKFFVDILKLMIPGISASQVREVMKDCKKTFYKNGKWRPE